MKQTRSRPNRVGSADLCVCFVNGGRDDRQGICRLTRSALPAKAARVKRRWLYTGPCPGAEGRKNRRLLHAI
jgi:hypothetical protein